MSRTESASVSWKLYQEIVQAPLKIHKEREEKFKNVIGILEAKYGNILNIKPPKQDEFLVPEIPKPKKETKDPRASKRNTSVLNKNTTLNQSSVDSENEKFRRSSRLASKTKLSSLAPPNITVEAESAVCNTTYIVSPSQVPNKIRRTSDKRTSVSSDKEATTPINIKSEKVSVSSDKENLTPTGNSECPVKGESVKKRIEEFEKRAKGQLNPTKLPMKNTSSLKKTDERSRKVAAQREAAEKEKLNAVMKLEKEKEEKFRQLQKQKDEKLREERLKKRQLAAAKAAKMEERRKIEEAAKIAKMKKTQIIAPPQNIKKDMPQYEIANVLEGDSSEDEERPKKQIPNWATKKMREYPLNVQAWLRREQTIYPWFYNKNLKYPKLEELFSKEVKTRPRTSSAVWNSKICFNESFPLI